MKGKLLLVLGIPGGSGGDAFLWVAMRVSMRAFNFVTLQSMAGRQLPSLKI
jgi:hypothetical protein